MIVKHMNLIRCHYYESSTAVVPSQLEGQAVIMYFIMMTTRPHYVLSDYNRMSIMPFSYFTKYIYIE